MATTAKTSARHSGDFGLNAGAAKAIGDLERGIVSATGGITAHAAGGQTNAVALTGAVNRVTVVATAGDSVKLPAAIAGARLIVKNAGANSANVFPSSGDAINALAADAAYALAAAGAAEFVCAVDGTWDTVLSA